MAGKKGKSGRRPGSTSWWRNPAALAGHQLNAYIEAWLGGVPIRVQTREGDRWLMPPTERRYTVPPKVKRMLAEMAINHVLDSYPNLKRTTIEQVLAWSKRQAPSVTLRRQARAKPRDETEIAYREMIERLENAWKRHTPF